MLKNLFKVIYKVTEQGLEITLPLANQQLLSETVGMPVSQGDIYDRGYIFHEEQQTNCIISKLLACLSFTFSEEG